MPKPRSRVTKKCVSCGKTFEVIKARENTAKCCSISCSSIDYHKNKNPNRVSLHYPKILGTCLYCGGDIVAKNPQFNKPGRKFCSQSCHTSHKNKNVPWTDARRKMVSDRATKTFTGRTQSLSQRANIRAANLGEKSHFWQGGKTSEASLARTSAKYRSWRKAVFERDNYTCQQCGARNGKGKSVYLNADHVIPFSQSAKLRYKVSNGRTLCVECHRKTDTFGNKLAKKRPVSQHSKSGDLIKNWPSVSNASKSTGISRSSMYNCLEGRSKTSGGYVWKYV